MFESKWDLPRIGEPVVMFCARCGGKLEVLLEPDGAMEALPCSRCGVNISVTMEYVKPHGMRMVAVMASWGGANRLKTGWKEL